MSAVMPGLDTTTGFESAADQRAHFKTDFHRVNVKRRLANRGPLSEDDFEKLLDKHEVRFHRTRSNTFLRRY